MRCLHAPLFLLLSLIPFFIDIGITLFNFRSLCLSLLVPLSLSLSLTSIPPTPILPFRPPRPSVRRALQTLPINMHATPPYLVTSINPPFPVGRTAARRRGRPQFVYALLFTPASLRRSLCCQLPRHSPLSQSVLLSVSVCPSVSTQMKSDYPPPCLIG